MANLSNMTGHLVIDGHDAWQELGFVVRPGSMESWLLLPELKEPFSHDWKDEDGIEVDLENIHLKDKKTSLKCYFISDSEVAFWNKYNALVELLTSPGLRNIYYRELDKEFEVYYTRSSDPRRIKGLKNSDVIVIEITLHFVMPDPGAIVERLVAPSSISLSVASTIVGSGSFSYWVNPGTASQNVRTTIIPVTGTAYVAGNMIYASSPGTVTLRIASTVDSGVYAQQTINVYPGNIVHFADMELLSDGFDWITES
jgi:hypothetical protein